MGRTITTNECEKRKFVVENCVVKAITEVLARMIALWNQSHLQ